MKKMLWVSMFHGPADRKTQEEGEDDEEEYKEGESGERE